MQALRLLPFFARIACCAFTEGLAETSYLSLAENTLSLRDLGLKAILLASSSLSTSSPTLKVWQRRQFFCNSLFRTAEKELGTLKPNPVEYCAYLYEIPSHAGVYFSLDTA